jgi:putative Holliday junction resolvase
MRTLGLDVGTRRIGVALSDALGLTAQPLVTLPRRGTPQDCEALAALARRHQVGAVVVGLPLALSGAHGPQAQRVRVFAQAVGERLAVPVHMVDERFTTAQAQRALVAGDVSRRRRKQVVDQAAAQLILQGYLDATRASQDR